MFLKKFFAEIGHFFEGLFNASQKAWDKLEPDVKDAMIHGSGIIAIFNENLEAAPAFIFTLIQSKFPDLTKDKIEEILKKAAVGFKIGEDIIDADLLTVIQRIQDFLSGLQGNTWANISHALGLAITAILAPPATKFATFASLFEFLYRTYIRKHD